MPCQGMPALSVSHLTFIQLLLGAIFLRSYRDGHSASEAHWPPVVINIRGIRGSMPIKSLYCTCRGMERRIVVQIDSCGCLSPAASYKGRLRQGLPDTTELDDIPSLSFVYRRCPSGSIRRQHAAPSTSD
ncbi:hypothetical protein B0H17DRAFT_483006 [Mycena rosella]|uniref:Secreted protein n=1 Tax=Mycena rosella TaxID=1033263 RepID=A0AAD7DL57_MYCRO|nr:hypothetical protein B0H17DRAFT_483006 [Mycena rosella]